MGFQASPEPAALQRLGEDWAPAFFSFYPTAVAAEMQCFVVKPAAAASEDELLWASANAKYIKYEGF